MSDGRQCGVRDSVSLPSEFETLHVGTLLHDPETGAILDANSRLEELYGYSAAELQELTIDDISANTYTQTQQAIIRRIRAAADGEPQSFEWRIKRADGELIWGSINLSQITIAGQSYALGEVTDITEYRHNDRRVSLFYRLLRHNLRNHINVIAGFANHIETISETEAAETAAQKIQTAASDMTRISESVKQIETTITCGDSNWQSRSAVEIITEIVDAFELPAPATVSVSERTEMWVAVGEAFEYAIVHAIENAVVHSNQPEPSVEIIVDESPNTGRAEIRIVDDGPQIPGMEIQALDEYSETTTTSHGSGVGLFVMKWCIESLGGELAIERPPEGGNVVSFYLPPKKPNTTVDPDSITGSYHRPLEVGSRQRSTD